MGHPKFMILRDANYQYYYRLFDHRGRILLTGASKPVRSKCVAAIHSLYTLIQNDDNFGMGGGSQGHRFHIYSAAGERICTSKCFLTLTGMTHGIAAARKAVCESVIEDLSMNVRFFKQHE